MPDLIPFPGKCTLREQEETYEYFVHKDKIVEDDNEAEWQRQYELELTKPDGEQLRKDTD